MGNALFIKEEGYKELISERVTDLKKSGTASFFYSFALSLISGVLFGLSFPMWLNIPTGILAWFALVPMLISLRGVPNFKTYFFLTFPFLIVGVYILCSFVAAFGFAAWFFSGFSQTLLIYPTFIIHYFLQKRFGWKRALLAFPFLYTFGDWLQHLAPHSFQITSPAYTQTTVLWFAQYADIFGMYGITFWVIALNVSLAISIERFQNKMVRTQNIAPLKKILLFFKSWAGQGVLFLGLPLVYSFWSNLQLLEGKFVKVALVQTNVDSREKIDSVKFNKNITDLIRLATQAAENKPDLIILPESALQIPLMQNREAFKLLCNYVANTNASVAVGFPEFPDTANYKILYNSAFVLTPQLASAWDSLGKKTSDLKVYRKQHPMPFTEMMPYRGFINLPKLFGSETLSGDETYVFSFPDSFDHEIKTSMTICWEQMFGETQAELAVQGAQFFSQMNNDGWFGNSSGAAFLLNINRMRAIENRRTVARSSNTGISCFIDPFGKLYGVLSPQLEGVKAERVYLNSDLTFYTVHKNWFPKFCGLVLSLVVVFWLLVNRRRLLINQQLSTNNQQL